MCCIPLNNDATDKEWVSLREKPFRCPTGSAPHRHDLAKEGVRPASCHMLIPTEPLVGIQSATRANAFQSWYTDRAAYCLCCPVHLLTRSFCKHIKLKYSNPISWGWFWLTRVDQTPLPLLELSRAHRKTVVPPMALTESGRQTDCILCPLGSDANCWSREPGILLQTFKGTQEISRVCLLLGPVKIFAPSRKAWPVTKQVSTTGLPDWCTRCYGKQKPQKDI